MNRPANIPADFDLLLAIDALQGVAQALYHEITEGHAAGKTLDHRTHANLVGLSWIARRLAREVSDFLRAASEAGFEFPELRDEEKVREIASPPYVN